VPSSLDAGVRPSSAAAFELRADGSFRYAPAAGLTEAIDLAEPKLHRVM
jgi:hypothetical protein